MSALLPGGGAWQDEYMQSSQASSHLIGRGEELRSLAESYGLAVQSKPQAVVVAGEAGLGKTRLLREFLHGLPESTRILSGQCVDLGPLAAPYAPITSILRGLAGETGLAQLMELAGPGRDALALLLPEAGTAGPGFPTANLVLEAVSTVLERAAEGRPTVVVVEDLHWADKSTLAVLGFILRAFNGGQFLLVMTYRSDDVHSGHPLQAFLAEAERGRFATTIQLARLNRDQVRQQLESITGTAADYELVENILSRSDGIPFFVEELAGLDGCASGTELPPSLRQLLLARYERMAEPVQYFLRVIAAGGTCVPHPLAENAYDRPRDTFEPAARLAQQARLIDVDGDSYTFRHALLREAVHSDLLPGERTRFHTRYAQALEAAEPARRDTAAIAYHWDTANAADKTFEASVAAMDEAWRRFAYTTSARMGERALELWDGVGEPEKVAGMPRYRLLARTAAAHNLAGDGERSLAVIALAVDDPAATGQDRARLLASQARYLGFNARPGSEGLLREALELVPAGSDERLRARLLNWLAARLMLAGKQGDAIEMATEALELATAAGNAEERSVAANLRGVSRINAGDIAGGRTDLEAAEGLAEGHVQALLRFRVNYSDALNLLGLYDESIRVAEAGIERARQLGVERTTGAILSSNAVDPLFARGDWVPAATLLERNLQLSPPGSFHAYLIRSKIWSTLWGGDVAGAGKLFRRWEPQLRGLAAVEMQSRLQLTTLSAELAWACGDLDGAWQEVAFVLGPAFRPLPGYDLPLLALAARVLAARRRAGAGASGAGLDGGRLSDDEALLRAVLAGDAFWPTHPGWLALFDAEVGGRQGSGDDPAAWHAAGLAAAALPAHLRHYIALRTGQAELAAGRRTAAASSIRAAIDGSQALGARLVADMGRKLAAQAGLPLDGPRRRPNSGELTGRERQVLALVADGLSNRQIGEQLFISTKTASVHVSAIMRKLGASSRTEAASRVMAPGPGKK
ncbi:LuxR family transcriptional regulator [Arthrobacter sp. SDTb3-6]|uniref:helix-turn-helix transcriptional regulator n=1 Tax=Arthrobacter sp. SDTb3-6 TaxID=2713571 RepID=UPI00159E029A|nr:AAA family ATPase [Arthrobacter sp. SDTb3-6]